MSGEKSFNNYQEKKDSNNVDDLLEKLVNNNDYRPDKFSFKWWISDLFESFSVFDFEDCGFSVIFFNALILFSLISKSIFNTNLLYLLIADILIIIIYFIASAILISRDIKKNNYERSYNIDEIKLYAAILLTFIGSIILLILLKDLNFIFLFLFVNGIFIINYFSMKLYYPLYITKRYDKIMNICSKYKFIKLFVYYVPVSHILVWGSIIFFTFNLFGILSFLILPIYLIFSTLVISIVEDNISF